MADLPRELGQLNYGEDLLKALARIGDEFGRSERERQAREAGLEVMRRIDPNKPESYLGESLYNAISGIPLTREGEAVKNRIYNSIGQFENARKLQQEQQRINISAVRETSPGAQNINVLTGEPVGPRVEKSAEPMEVTPSKEQLKRWGLPEFTTSQQESIDSQTGERRVNEVKVPTTVLYDKNTSLPMKDEDGRVMVAKKPVMRTTTPATHSPSSGTDKSKQINATFFTVNIDKSGNVALHETKQTYQNATQLVSQADTQMKSIDAQMASIQAKKPGLISWERLFGTTESWDTIKDKLNEETLAKIDNSSVRNLATAYLKWKTLKAQNFNRYQEEQGAIQGGGATPTGTSADKPKLNYLSGNQ